jgi:hypothetical protein
MMRSLLHIPSAAKTYRIVHDEALWTSQSRLGTYERRTSFNPIMQRGRW